MRRTCFKGIFTIFHALASRTEFDSPRRAGTQVREVMHPQAACYFAQSFTSRGEEPAQQPALAEFLQSRPPVLGAAASRSRIPETSAEIAALPSRKSRPV